MRLSESLCLLNANFPRKIGHQTRYKHRDPQGFFFLALAALASCPNRCRINPFQRTDPRRCRLFSVEAICPIPMSRDFFMIPGPLADVEEFKYSDDARLLLSPKTVNKGYWIISVTLNIILSPSFSYLVPILRLTTSKCTVSTHPAILSLASHVSFVTAPAQNVVTHKRQLFATFTERPQYSRPGFATVYEA